MKTADFDYDLPASLIARRPLPRREDSRLLRLDRASGDLSHHFFRDLPHLLRPDDLLVLNDTRVFPARLLGRRRPDGGKVEALLLNRDDAASWWALVKPGKKIKEGDRLVFAPGRLEAVVESYGKRGGGKRLLRFEYRGEWWGLLEEIGHTPLPPYVLRARKEDAQLPSAVPLRARESILDLPEDRERYQTVYAGAERASVAAPTAGLHFSRTVLDELDRCGIERIFIQLNIGAGTFQPIKTDNIEDHPIHEEFFCLSAEAAERLNLARAQGRRIVAVGTTVVRALETAALVAAGKGEGIFRPETTRKGLEAAWEHRPQDTAQVLFVPLRGWTRLLIVPGFRFRAVNALLTNFHLPRSTLLVLVGAFAGVETILRAYREAVQSQYRFYSYGDCMFIE